MVQDAWAALEEEFGPSVDQYEVTTTEGLQPRTFGANRGTGPDISVLYPLHGGEEREWKCVDCGVRDFEGFGCIGCVEFVCIECVRFERHTYHQDATLRAVGDAFDRSKERIRQVQEGAIRKIRIELLRLLGLLDNPVADIDQAIHKALKAREEAEAKASVDAAVLAASAAAEAEAQQYLDNHPFHHGLVGKPAAPSSAIERMRAKVAAREARETSEVSP